MALTGLAQITYACYQLGTLKAGGVPSSDQQTAFLVSINKVLEGLQLEGALGIAITKSLTGQSDTTGISSAGVVTNTAIGGTTTTVATPVAVATYATLGTINTYPIGWDEVLAYIFAVEIAGAQGSEIPEHVQKNADAGRSRLLGAVAKGPATPA